MRLIDTRCRLLAELPGKHTKQRPRIQHNYRPGDGPMSCNTEAEQGKEQNKTKCPHELAGEEAYCNPLWRADPKRDCLFSGAKRSRSSCRLGKQCEGSHHQAEHRSVKHGRWDQSRRGS